MAGKKITIFEVGPRDGLQNESKLIPFHIKFQYIQKLFQAGLKEIEIGSFVRPDRVPQMADTTKVLKLLPKKIKGWVLVPNERGLDMALDAGCKKIAIFTATSDKFAKKNIGMTSAQSLMEFKKICKRALKEKLTIRGYVSTVWGCPYNGDTNSNKTLKITESLLDMGCFQVSLGDTIGVAVPMEVRMVLEKLISKIAPEKLAGHFHDTRGTALSNAWEAVQLGLTTLDSSSGGIGGCPFAAGATGNLATEDLCYFLEKSGFNTGVSLEKVADASLYLENYLDRKLTSRVLNVLRK